MKVASRVLLGSTIFCVAAVVSSNPGVWAAGTIYEGNDQAYAGQGQVL